MDNVRVDVSVAEEVIAVENRSEAESLSNFELALVGGGIGNTIL
jgi:hypothetical protein